jgi:hypothetical protein
VSNPGLLDPFAAGPAPGADPLRTMILGGLAYAALGCRDTGDTDLAGRFEDAYMQVANGGTAWCDLAVKLISEMN